MSVATSATTAITITTTRPMQNEHRPAPLCSISLPRVTRTPGPVVETAAQVGNAKPSGVPLHNLHSTKAESDGTGEAGRGRGCDEVDLLHSVGLSERERTDAIGSLRLDKLGVTGSSPVRVVHPSGL
jgi:hypothetical protein